MSKLVKAFAFIMVCFIFLPILPLLFSFFNIEKDLWSYFYSQMLSSVLWKTLILLFGVGIGTFVLGLSSAWICSQYEFPGRKLMSRLLILPLAIPGYIYAFVYIGIMDFSGPVQSFLRNNLGWNLDHFFSFRSVFGLIFVLSLSLFPYIYLLSKNAFSKESFRLREVASSLGVESRDCFWRLHLPMAWPWVLSGMSFVVLETLSDFGSVSVFNYMTFTLAIYKLWYGFFSWPMAAQMSSFLVLFAFLFFILSEKWEGRRRFYFKVYKEEKLLKLLKGKKAWMFSLWIGLILFFSLALPLAQLMYWAFERRAFLDVRWMSFLFNSLVLAFIGSALLILFSFGIVFSERMSPSLFSRFILRLSSLGYSIPGMVLAVGIVAVFSFVDRLFLFLFGEVLFANHFFGLLWAYLSRFLILGVSSLRSALKRIPRSLDESASSLGLKSKQVILKVHKPLLSSGLGVAFVLSFVEMIKEMPMALMIRPLGWETLSVYIFQLTSEGEWERAALPSLFIVFIGLVFVLLVEQKSRKDRTL